MLKNTLTPFIGILALSVLCLTLSNQKVHAASDSASALQTVVAALGIVKVSDLDFGSAAQGDIAKTVAPASGAVFTVTGAPSYAYSITLPTDGTVTMTNGGATIAVDSFVSDPVEGAGTGTLDGAGTQTLRVGATRAALAPTQAVGSYSGSFMVTVVY